MEKLIRFFEDYVNLTEKEKSFLSGNVKIRDCPKNHLLLAEGDVSNEFYFITKGAIRMYYMSDFEEKTAYFYTENMFVSSYRSFIKQIPATHYLATIEDSELVVFDREAANALIGYSQNYEILARIMMEEELTAYQDIVSMFVTQNAEERYLKLMTDRPEIFKRIPQHQIATYLGVSPETLSRIRKRIVSK